MDIILSSNAMTHPVTFSGVLCNAMIESINVDVIASGQSYCFIDSRGSTCFIKTQPIEFPLVAKNMVRHKYNVTMIATSLKSVGYLPFIALTKAFLRTGPVSLVSFWNLLLRNADFGFLEYLNDMAPLPASKPKIKVMSFVVKVRFFLPTVNAFVFSL